MNFILKLEELALFVFGLVLFGNLSFDWWWFPALLLIPDIGMLGYLAGAKTGAWMYNIFHHRAVAVLIYLLGFYLINEYLMLAGIILFSHAAMDRIFGYGLKYEKGFKFTHLGELN